MSKICLYCRKEVEDTSVFCPNCGHKVENNSNMTPTENTVSTQNITSTTVNTNNQTNSNVQKNDNNVIAIVGFVLSIISPLCCCGTSWIGLILSIIGLIESKKKNGKGKSLAIAGIIIGAVLLALLVIIYILNFFSVFTKEMNNINTGRYY